MKRFFALILISIMLFSVSLAELPDVKSMSTSDLKVLLNMVRNEYLDRLPKATKNTSIVNDNTIQMYCTGKGNDSSGTFNLEVVIVNKSNDDFSIFFDHIVIDGWETDCIYYISEIGSGKKKKSSITLEYSDADMSSYKEMNDIELTFHLSDSNYKKIKEYSGIIFDFAGSSWN